MIVYDDVSGTFGELDDLYDYYSTNLEDIPEFVYGTNPINCSKHAKEILNEVLEIIDYHITGLDNEDCTFIDLVTDTDRKEFTDFMSKWLSRISSLVTPEMSVKIPFKVGYLEWLKDNA